MTLPPLERYLNWVHDIASPPSRDHGKENMPPQDAPCKLPRKLRLRRRRERQPGSTTNHNSPSWKAGRETQCEPASYHNSVSREAGRETQPGSTTNHNSPLREVGNWPETSGSAGSAMRAPVEHPLTFLRPQHPQHPRLRTNQNSERRSDPDHSEFWCVYKPVQPSIQQDSTIRFHRDSFSVSGLSSPALQRSHRDSFSGLPPGHLNKKLSLTDPKREERIAGGLRPGLILPHPRAACPDTRLELDAAPPEAAAVRHAEQPPTVLDIPEAGQLETTRCPEPSHRRGSRSPRNRSSALYRPKKRPPHPGHWCE